MIPSIRRRSDLTPLVRHLSRERIYLYTRVELARENKFQARDRHDAADKGKKCSGCISRQASKKLLGGASAIESRTPIAHD